MPKNEKLYNAKTLEEAYEKASLSLKCSLDDLYTEVVQYPTNGFFGLFSKEAIIKASINKDIRNSKPQYNHSKNINIEPLSTKLESLSNEKEKIKEKKSDIPLKQVKKENIFNEFYDTSDDSALLEEEILIDDETISIETEIKEQINMLFKNLCYEIDEIEVKVLDSDNTVNIIFSGADSALLIGKEGYRYKSLSYILFNWINEKYNMMLRLEVAEFLKNQEESVHTYLVPVIETIKNDGYFKTKVLDGILVHIALTKLRDEFPDKYVAVKSNSKGEKYILVNEYRN
ncbi:MAG: Jag N-terminal domain-containing protein [Campylobacterota bacterium]|nr:Jag N-terminal domain-containing protein [Campylobacterota bacterium]